MNLKSHFEMRFYAFSVVRLILAHTARIFIKLIGQRGGCTKCKYIARLTADKEVINSITSFLFGGFWSFLVGLVGMVGRFGLFGRFLALKTEVFGICLWLGVVGLFGLFGLLDRQR